MSNLEVVGSLMLYARARDAEGIKEAVIQAEAEGNVIVDIIPIYEGMEGDLDVTGVFLKVAGSTKAKIGG